MAATYSISFVVSYSRHKIMGTCIRRGPTIQIVGAVGVFNSCGTGVLVIDGHLYAQVYGILIW